MKRKHRKVLQNIRSLNPGTHWMDVEDLLVHLGAARVEGSGSIVTLFVDEEHHLTVDRPHPRRECGVGLVKRVRRFLRITGHL